MHWIKSICSLSSRYAACWRSHYCAFIIVLLATQLSGFAGVLEEKCMEEEYRMIQTELKAKQEEAQRLAIRLREMDPATDLKELRIKCDEAATICSSLAGRAADIHRRLEELRASP